MERIISGVERSRGGLQSQKRYRLTQAQLDRAHCQIDIILNQMGLQRRPNVVSSRSWMDGLAIEYNTKGAYDKHLRGLWYFFSLIQDYESLIVLLPDAPLNVPSMNVDSISKYFRH
jgi:hypothetical protein